MSARRALSKNAKRLAEIELSINADPVKATEALKALRAEAARTGEGEKLLRYCDLLVGRCMQRRGLYNEAHDVISESARHLEALRAWREAATGYHYLSQINAGRHDMQAALESCLHGQEIVRKVRDRYLQMNLEIDMGPVYRSLGDSDASIEAYKRGLDIYLKYVKGKDPRIAGQEEYTEFIITLNIAIQNLNCKRYANAKTALDSVAGREQHVLGGAYIDLYNLEYARVCFGLKLIDEAVARADIVTERLENDEKRSLHGATINYLGLTDDLIKCGELERAWKLLGLVRPVIERDDTPRVMGVLMMVLAGYYKAAGDKDTALQYYQDFAEYIDRSEARDTEENRTSMMRRIELQKTLRESQAADAARERQLESLRQQMEYRAEREEILRNISENTDSFFLLYNTSSGTVDFVSQNSLRLFGIDLTGETDPCAALIKWLGMENAREFLSGELRERVSAEYEVINPATGAPMIVHQELIPSRDRPSIMVLTDVTRIMQTHNSLITAIEAARQASDAKTNFLSSMSHDIRTPLNAIVGLLEMLDDNIEDMVTARDLIEKMRQSTNHLRALINDMLDMSRIEAGRMRLASEEFTMPEFLESVMVIMRPQALARKLDLALVADEADDGALIGDPLRMRQAFINILGNAVKFTDAGGKVTLTVQKTDAGGSAINYRFDFVDTGCGMTPEFLSRIFVPFERAENAARAVEGTGLGMAITKSLIDMMSGSISVKSALGEGTQFTVHLKLTRKEAVPLAPEPEHRQIPASAARTGKILLVEDNELNAEIAIYVIRKFGYETALAENGQIALDMLANTAPGEISLVLMDVRMPVMNGYEATARIRASEREDIAKLPIIAMTADAFEEDVRKALDSGMNAHIAKPMDSVKLLELLRQHI